MKRLLKSHLLIIASISIATCVVTRDQFSSIVVDPSTPVTIEHEVVGSLTKKLFLTINNRGQYAGFSLYSDDVLLIDDYNVPQKGVQRLNCTVNFPKKGIVKLRFESLDAPIVIENYHFEDQDNLKIPVFKDISENAGLDKVSSLKYGGPSVADIDNDGDYDFIVNNHNAESSKLYWNNGDGTVEKHSKNLSRWFKHDLHGTALGDYDNDGDLDLILTQGGGNGKNPSRANFYLNDNKTLVRYTGDVGIDKGGRGRGAKWVDMDLDGDLDMILFNEASLAKEKPQQYFYKNDGDGKFEFVNVEGIQDVEESRLIVTDFNGDQIDDLVFYSPISLWKGNGDFTFTNVSHLIPGEIKSLSQVMGMTDIDIDNDGDLDFYLACGKLFEHGEGESPSLDFIPQTEELSIKTRGYKGVDAFDFGSEGSIKLHNYYYLAQGPFIGQDYPIFLGKVKTPRIVKSTEELEIHQNAAEGWPDDISEDGFYLGYLGNSRWKAALVRNGNYFWQYRFSLSGVSKVTPLFTPENRNQADFLLRNDGNKFTDVSEDWNIPSGGNALGVTVGDFNNDSYQDLFIYRWGRIGSRVSDLMLLNSGKQSFETITMHGANDVGGPGNGDMGQAFDFDLDGRVDLLNGSEGGEWYLYSNQTKEFQNFVTVRVGYSHEWNMDPISAEVIVTTPGNTYKKRVGSAGEIFSQSLMNIVHFGLGEEKKINHIQVRWRNGESVEFKDKPVNAIYETDHLDPTSILIETTEIQENTKAPIRLNIKPDHANKDIEWSSNNEEIISVDQEGIISAHGKINQATTIKALSKVNGLTTRRKIKIVEWSPIPVKSITLHSEDTMLYLGQKAKVTATISPITADYENLKWSSDDPNILSVDEQGNVKAISPGITDIRVSNSENTVTSEIQFNVTRVIEPFIKIANKEEFIDQSLKVGDEIQVKVQYHAGSGNRVISADEGGIRFWLRHFKSKWIPQKDIVLTHKKSLYTESGSAIMTISLEETTPTRNLPVGHFYQLRVTFTSSDGEMYEDGILPLQIN